jgi:hypothetical protein
MCNYRKDSFIISYTGYKVKRHVKSLKTEKATALLLLPCQPMFGAEPN